MSSIPAYTIGGITRPELFLDPAGNIVLTPDAQHFADLYGIGALYWGCPPGTPYPPVTGLLLTTPVDTNAAANHVAEGAAANTLVGVTAEAHDIVGFPITYSLTNSANGAFKINASTGVVTVADPSKIDFESAPGHTLTITVQATDGIFFSQQNFVIGVDDVAPSAPVDSNVSANTVAENAANGTVVGVTASSTDVNGGTVTYSILAGDDSSGGGFTVNAATGVVTVANHSKIDYESAPGHAYTVKVTASDGTLTSSQTFTIAVSDVAPGLGSGGSGVGSVNEGAAAGTHVANSSATDVNGGALTYSLIGDTSGGGFTINATTGEVTVANPAKIDYESAPGHGYSVTVRASDGTLSTDEIINIAVNDVAPTAPTDSNAAANTVVEGAANGSTVGVTASATDVN